MLGGIGYFKKKREREREKKLGSSSPQFKKNWEVAHPNFLIFDLLLKRIN